eukprot:3382560-Amphidinium_carterae.1
MSLDDEGSHQHFRVNFADGRGKMFMLHISIRLCSDGRYEVKSAQLSGKFELMSDFVVVQHSKSNFFRSKSWDEIVYIPRGVTQLDIQTILGALSPPAAFSALLSGSEPDKIGAREEL